MVVLLANNARSTLAGAVETSDTTISIQTGDAARFPAPTGGDWFPATIVKADGSFEIVRVTGRASGVLTVTRAQEGTTALDFAADDRVDLRLTAAAIAQIQADAAGSACPPGMIAPFAMTSPPTGWLKANGAAVSRATYAALFAAIGTAHGAGNGSTTFNLPDLRGEFIRGLDDGRGVDSGRTLGSSQADMIEAHEHTATAASAGGHTPTGVTASAGSHTHSGSANSAGAHSHTGSASSAGAHTHSASTSSDGAHSHSFTGLQSGGSVLPSTSGAGGTWASATGSLTTLSTGSAGSHSHSVTVNSDGAHSHTLSIDSGGAHTHTLSIDSGGAHTHTITMDAVAAHTHTITVASTGGAETRPRNVAELFCIKY